MPVLGKRSRNCVRDAPVTGVMSRTVMLPPVGCSRSAMTRISVVLPQPLGPIKDMKSPCSTLRSTSESAWDLPIHRIECQAQPTGFYDRCHGA